MTGYRVYFNRHNEWPQVWSVDEGAGPDGKPLGEINVIGFSVNGRGYSKYDLKADNYWSPKAWIWFPNAELDVVGGEAIITSM